ncbi:undecaprenyl-diphosphate phosphatase [uncultured Succinivibrio sp.]|uniref:undecaprenyl-diphosphate phosphatase n=1 Tax=uncultured Succinivibrio sp. TaxID=540749 RepID=UPI0025EFBEEB|nr:undecaprenyl-diphosphate phosphatase [uncultured Succinivibrio sp.]
MTFLHVLVLAIVQGLTEFLPVSSSAHLIFPAKLLGWPDQGLAFDVAVHLGTLMAVVLYYLADLVKISSYTIEACIKMQISPLARIGFCMIIATLPVCVVGSLCEGYISSALRDNIDVIAYTTIGFGILLGIASYVNKKMVWRNIDNIQGARSDSLRGLSYTQALVIGLFQALAVFPGVSRSGITLTAGLFMGMKSEAAARFSFLLAIPVIIASGAFEIYKIYSMETLDLQWVNLIIGAMLSFIVAIIVIHLFLKYIAKSGMAVFVIYRVLLGALLLWLF